MYSRRQDRKILPGPARTAASKLLAGATLVLLSAGASAGELALLKEKILQLEQRVFELDVARSTPKPRETGAVVLSRGQGSLAEWHVGNGSDEHFPKDSGFTFTVLPTAGQQSPALEVAAQGYVKADFFSDFDQTNLGTTFTHGVGNDARYQQDRGFSTTAGQTRLRLRASRKTPVGRARMVIESDFFSSCSGDKCYRLRHAWGAWDITPEWTIGLGQFWRVGYDQISGIRMIDFGGAAGEPENSRVAQIRLNYVSGAVNLAFGLQAPNTSTSINTNAAGIGAGTDGDFGNTPYKDTPNLPRLGGHLVYEISPVRRIFIGGEIQQHNMDMNASGEEGPIPLSSDSTIGWIASIGTKFALNDWVTLTGRVVYSDGMNALIASAGASTTVNDTGTGIRRNTGWGGFAGVGIALSDRVAFNTQWGFADPSDKAMRGNGISWSHIHTLHSNILWRPVTAMRLGYEFMWSQKTNGKNFLASSSGAGRKRNERALRGQFGAWFFF